MSGHTETPWRLDDRSRILSGVGPFNWIRLPSPWVEGAWDNDKLAEANAAFIVQACNAYDSDQRIIAELRAALAEAKALLLKEGYRS